MIITINEHIFRYLVKWYPSFVGLATIFFLINRRDRRDRRVREEKKEAKQLMRIDV